MLGKVGNRHTGLTDMFEPHEFTLYVEEGKACLNDDTRVTVISAYIPDRKSVFSPPNVPVLLTLPHSHIGTVCLSLIRVKGKQHSELPLKEAPLISAGANTRE